MKARAVFGAIIAIVVGVGVLSAGTVQAGGGPHGMVAHTQIIHVKPFLSMGGLAPGYKVRGTVSGYCWESSLVTNRRDAFRCFHGNGVLDPCFRDASGRRVACPLDSTPTTVEIIRLTKRLPRVAVSGGPRAWELTIANGAVCSFDSGATFLAGGKRANFDCTDKTSLFGHAKTARQPWQIRRGRGLHPHFKWVNVKTAWF